MGATPLESVYDGIRASSPCWTACLRGVPVAVFGLAGTVVWMLATPRFRSLRRGLVQEAKWWVDEIQGDLPMIHNYIDTRQTKNIRWLRSLGFTVGPTELACGVNGETFTYFWRSR